MACFPRFHASSQHDFLAFFLSSFFSTFKLLSFIMSKKKDPLGEIKNEYYYTRLLSDDQFNKLKRNEKKLLMISWGFPADSILSVTGGVWAKQNWHVLFASSTHSVYAKWEMTTKRIKKTELRAIGGRLESQSRKKKSSWWIL